MAVINKIKTPDGTAYDVAGGTIYATCSTAAATAAKTATVANGATFSLFQGAKVSVKFTYANSAASPTLNVASTGAKAIWFAGAALTSAQYWAANQVIDFVYDGSYWQVLGANKDNNTTYSAGTNVTISSDKKINVPSATKDTAGVTVVYPETNCTTFTTDEGTCTPLAIQKAAKMFSITRPTKKATAQTVTTNAIVRWENTSADVKDSKITIEDVTNTKDSSKKANVLVIPAEGNKKMVYGYCTDQVDGTSFIGGVFDANATSYPYASGLAIGGTSGNLLWKGSKVAVTSDIPTVNNGTLTIQKNGTNVATFTANQSSNATANITVPTKTSQLTNDSGFKTTDTDTKNTTGSTNTSSKIFLVGATSQAANPQTYSHDTAYVGTDGYLYSNSEKVWPRIYGTLIPYGTEIPAKADLNTVTYLKVGNYYCGSNATVKTFKNCPLTTYNSSGVGTDGSAFMMQVYSPLSPTLDNETTGTWVYRIRKIIHYSTGIEYTQYCYVGGTAGASNWTYGDWYVTPKSAFTFNKTSASTAAVGSTTKPVYVNSSGNIVAGSTYGGGTAVTLNGTSKAASAASFYAPTKAAAGTGEICAWSSGGPTWVGQSTITAGVATKLGTANKGTSTQPIYLAAGVPTACTYTLAKSVPSNAVFTDTTYGAASSRGAGLMSAADKVKLDGIHIVGMLAIYGQEVSFTAGQATITNKAIIKDKTVVFCQRRGGLAGAQYVTNYSTHIPANGQVLISRNEAATAVENVNILILVKK